MTKVVSEEGYHGNELSKQTSNLEREMAGKVSFEERKLDILKDTCVKELLVCVGGQEVNNKER